MRRREHLGGIKQGCWCWVMCPGRRYQFARAPGYAYWSHRFINIAGMRVERWVQDGLLPGEPQQVPPEDRGVEAMDALLKADVSSLLAPDAHDDVPVVRHYTKTGLPWGDADCLAWVEHTTGRRLRGSAPASGPHGAARRVPLADMTVRPRGHSAPFLLVEAGSATGRSLLGGVRAASRMLRQGAHTGDRRAGHAIRRGWGTVRTTPSLRTRYGPHDPEPSRETWAESSGARWRAPRRGGRKTCSLVNGTRTGRPGRSPGARTLTSPCHAVLGQ
jgi:hypothetical protein